MRLLTWNIGSFVFLKYQRYFRAGNFDHQEYFQPELNAGFVSQTIESIDPDFLFLQEFYFPEDAQTISSLRKYPNQTLINTWYREKSALIASKKPFQFQMQDGIASIEYEQHHLYPVHLNSFVPQKRLEESRALKQRTIGIKNLIIFGDFNYWKRKCFYVWQRDKNAYETFTQYLKDVTEKIYSTTCYGFGLDKIFATPDIQIGHVTSHRIRGRFMDHYPVYCDIVNS